MSDIEILRAQLKEAERVEREEREERRNSVTQNWMFMISLEDEPGPGYKELWDDTCGYYRITGVLLNREECEAVGQNVDRSGDGAGMSYLYNSLSQKLVCSVGGGQVWVGMGWDATDRESSRIAIDEINAFLINHPDGGDITDIIKRHRARKIRIGNA